MFSLPPFHGFPPEAFTFLRNLKENNDRDWFKAHKTAFDETLVFPMQCLLAEAGSLCLMQGLPLLGDPKRGIFRIYRDTRFSGDKTPYKTHLGAVLSRDGSRKDLGDFYIHVEPEGSFIGGGYWQPEPELLKKFRLRMSDDPEGFLALKAKVEAAGLSFETDEALKRLPKGFEAEAASPAAAYFKWKSLLGIRKFPNEALMSPDFSQTVVAAAQGLLPLLQYGWEILNETD